MSRLLTGRRHSSKNSFPYTDPDGFQNENVGGGGTCSKATRSKKKKIINR